MKQLDKGFLQVTQSHQWSKCDPVASFSEQWSVTHPWAPSASLLPPFGNFYPSRCLLLVDPPILLRRFSSCLFPHPLFCFFLATPLVVCSWPLNLGISPWVSAFVSLEMCPVRVALMVSNSSTLWSTRMSRADSSYVFRSLLDTTYWQPRSNLK